MMSTGLCGCVLGVCVRVRAVCDGYGVVWVYVRVRVRAVCDECGAVWVCAMCVCTAVRPGL